MNSKRIVTLALSAMVTSAAVFPSIGFTDERTVMPFADLGGTIKDWKTGPDDSLYVEGISGQWFKATFWGPCYDLKFHDAIAFVTEPTGDLSKFSSVLVGGQRCWFKTFAKVEKP